jgi:hypothetical protein
VENNDVEFVAVAKRWWQVAAVWYSAAIGVAGVVVEYLAQTNPDLTPFLGRWGGMVTIGIGIVNAIMHFRAKAK